MIVVDYEEDTKAIDKILTCQSDDFYLPGNHLNHELLEKIEKNKYLLDYIKQKQGWYRLCESCQGLRSVFKKAVVIAIYQADTFDDRMSYLSICSEKLQLYALSGAALFANTSERCLAVAENCSDEEIKEIVIALAIKKAIDSRDCFNILFFLTGPSKCQRKIETIGWLIKKGVSLSESIDDFEKIYNLFIDANDIFDFSERTVDQFKLLAIRKFTRTDVSFFFKREINQFANNKRSERAAIELMECALNMEKIQKKVQKLPKEDSTRRMFESICQNNK